MVVVVSVIMIYLNFEGKAAMISSFFKATRAGELLLHVNFIY